MDPNSFISFLSSSFDLHVKFLCILCVLACILCFTIILWYKVELCLKEIQNIKQNQNEKSKNKDKKIIQENFELSKTVLNLSDQHLLLCEIRGSVARNAKNSKEIKSWLSDCAIHASPSHSLMSTSGSYSSNMMNDDEDEQQEENEENHKYKKKNMNALSINKSILTKITNEDKIPTSFEYEKARKALYGVSLDDQYYRHAKCYTTTNVKKSQSFSEKKQT